jgi:hypothetical protein
MNFGGSWRFLLVFLLLQLLRRNDTPLHWFWVIRSN